MGKKQSTGRAKSIFFFIVLRILFFVVPLGVMLWMGFLPFYAAITAALIGLALSLIFLQKQRDPIVELLDRKNSPQEVRGRTEDEIAEDEIADAYRQQQRAAAEQSKRDAHDS